MLGGILGLHGVEIVFVCSSPIDEVWIRSTAMASHSRGMRVELAICGHREHCSVEVLNFYRDIGIKVICGISISSAARCRCELAVTASSGLDRRIFPTRAKKFIHMPHSLASLHMIYPPDAFDGYDILFAAGPQHEAEFAAIAASRGLEHRRSFAAGYGKLDVLAERQAARAPRPEQLPLILVAPSWGSDNLLDRCGVALAGALVDAGFDVVVRPHPLFFIENAPVIGDLTALQQRMPNVRLESPFDGDDAIFDADVLVGDYSGIGFEFAALRRRSVVSVDVGLKVVNTTWQSLCLQPVEVACRSRLGPVVPPDVEAIVDAVKRCTGSESQITDEAVSSFLYGQPGECADRAAAQLQRLLS
jgi:YidC/Oxa1 family membrane protein insertase